MDPISSTVHFKNQPSAPPPAYSAVHQSSDNGAGNSHHGNNHHGNNHHGNSSNIHPVGGSASYHAHPSQNGGNHALPIEQHPQYGQLMNDLKRPHSSQISQHPQAIQTANQIPQHHVSSGQNDNNNNNNNIVIVPQLQQPMVAAPYAGAQAPPPHVTAINVGLGEQGPRRYK